MDAATKQWIDNASYEELLRRWRFAPMGDPLFQGGVGDYYLKRMREKEQAMDATERLGGPADNPAAASKRVGWDRP